MERKTTMREEIIFNDKWKNLKMKEHEKKEHNKERKNLRWKKEF